MKAVTTRQMRELDQRTVAAGTPGAELMERAGFAVARAVVEILKQHNSRSVLLLAGKGNNGGDAIVAALHLAGAGCQPTLVLLCRRSELTGDALLHFQKLVTGIPIYELPTAAQLQKIVTEHAPAVVVDGLLGTGLTGDVREPFASAIKHINALQIPVIAIDIPSGLDGDSGVSHGVCVRADLTMTMGLPKIGLLKPTATDFVGQIEVADLGFPSVFVEEIETDVEFLTADDVRPLLPPRRRSAHKGDFGHLLVIAGSEGYTGAPVLCAHVAARAGVGLVTLAVPRAIYPIVAATCPSEIMPRSFDTSPDLAGFDAIAIGPGLGQSAAAQQLVARVLAAATVPVVADADALNVLARDAALWKTISAPIIVTPHPGEMGRLVGKTAAEVQADRWAIARQFASDHGVVTVLKGAGTVVTDKSGALWINSTGNPGMAKGGMGDALTGLIGALLAQGLTPLDAARAGVFIHGRAGDLARDRVGERALLATDLIHSLGAAFEIAS